MGPGQDTASIEAALGHVSNGEVRLGVLGTGLVLVEGHYEYVFQVSHPWGCSWKVQRRYRDLLSLHEDLTADQVAGVPTFPPKHSIAQVLFRSEGDIATKRIVELQKYLQLLVANQDLAQLPAVQRLLGTTLPESPSIVRVSNWEHGPSARVTMDLELELSDGSAQVPGNSAPIDAVDVHVSVVPRLGPLGGSAQGDIRKTYTVEFREPVQIPDLPSGGEVEFKVQLRNAMGSSEAVVVRCGIPTSDPDSPGSISSRPSLLPQNTSAPPLPEDQIGPGCRVLACWAGNGRFYDAIVRRAPVDGKVTVDWLRPAPLSEEVLKCVCSDGGDDTSHRKVPVEQLRPPKGDPASPDAPVPKETDSAGLLGAPVERRPPPALPQRRAPSLTAEEPRRSNPKVTTNLNELLDAAEEAPEIPSPPLPAAKRKPRTSSTGSSSLADLFDAEADAPDSVFGKPRASTTSTASKGGSLGDMFDGEASLTKTPSRASRGSSLGDLLGDDEDVVFKPPPRNSKTSNRSSLSDLLDSDVPSELHEKPRQGAPTTGFLSELMAEEDAQEEIASGIAREDAGDHADFPTTAKAPQSRKLSESAAHLWSEDADTPSPSKAIAEEGIVAEVNESPQVGAAPAKRRSSGLSAAVAELWAEDPDMPSTPEDPAESRKVAEAAANFANAALAEGAETPQPEATSEIPDVERPPHVADAPMAPSSATAEVARESSDADVIAGQAETDPCGGVVSSDGGAETQAGDVLASDTGAGSQASRLVRESHI